MVVITVIVKLLVVRIGRKGGSGGGASDVKGYDYNDGGDK